MIQDFSNTFNTEPIKQCPVCGEDIHAEWVDNGFGPYSVQVSPFHCYCGYVEGGCPAEKCIKEKCFSWNVCQGKSILRK